MTSSLFSNLRQFNPGGGTTIVTFGTTEDKPVTADHDGDGKTDAGVFRLSEANWYVQRSTAGTLIQQFGIAADQPVPERFCRALKTLKAQVPS